MNPLLQKIGEEFGLSTLPQEKQEELLTRIGGIIYKSVLIRALDRMSESEQNEFETLLDQDKNPEELFAFLQEKVPTIETIIKEESDAFKNEMTSVMNQVES